MEGFVLPYDLPDHVRRGTYGDTFHSLEIRTESKCREDNSGVGERLGMGEIDKI